MFSISLDKVGKKFNRERNYRQLSYEIQPKDKLVVQGGNGSGKSTLLQVISGYVHLNEGGINYRFNGKEIPVENVHQYVSFASPYLTLIEDFTATELIEHLAPAKPFVKNLPAENILEISELGHAGNKYIRQYSSGMKQRLKLALAILSDTPLLLLDEPLSNLDRKGTEWYKRMISDYAMDRSVIVCSNAISEEFDFCRKQINVMDFKN